jgi:transcriptional regulatory protein RtcR
VIGFLGTVLDKGAKGMKRWNKWRPTVSLCQQDDMLVNRFELLINDGGQRLADRVTEDIKQVSSETEVTHHLVNIKDPWDFEEVYGALHDFSLNYNFDLEKEEYFMHITTGTHVAQICMFLLTEARYFPAKLIQSAPLRNRATGMGNYAIIDLDLSKYDRIAQRFRIEHEEATSFLKSGITTRNQAFNNMIDLIEKVVIKTKSPVLLMGPTGAGKSQLARRIYDLKNHRHQINGPFVEINCATLKGDGSMSSLFGHKKGAFTGAVSDRPGLLVSANKGVLFLDEIGELGLDEQAMILRAIEEKRFLPVGSDKEVESDFQLLAGTNKDLTHEVAKGNFREDLLARLNLWTFFLPGLKDRREDIEPNIEFELNKYSQDNNQKVAFNKEGRKKYLKFSLSNKSVWSANFRDLSASINRMATLAEGGRITVVDVEDEIGRLQRLWHLSSKDPSTQILDSVLNQEQIDEIDLFDRVQLANVIKVCRNEKSLSAAGRRLFSNSRIKKKIANDADRLSKFLQRFGLNWATVNDDS